MARKKTKRNEIVLGRMNKMYSRGYDEANKYASDMCSDIMIRLGVDRGVILDFIEELRVESRKKLPPKESCGYFEPWRGPCKSTELCSKGRCEEHKVLCNCGKLATRGCSCTGAFVCGRDICDKCECNH